MSPVAGAAEQVRLRNAALLEEERGNGVCPHPAEVLDLPDGKAGGVLLHDEDPGAPLGVLRIGNGEDQRRAADAAVGHEDLRAVDDIILAVPDGDRLHPARIGAGVGLGQTEGADPLAAGHRREEAAFLLLGAEPLDGVDPHAVVDGEAEADRRADAGDLLDGDHVADGVHLRAAIRLRRLEAEKMERSHLLDNPTGKRASRSMSWAIGPSSASANMRTALRTTLCFMQGLKSTSLLRALFAGRLTF